MSAIQIKLSVCKVAVEIYQAVYQYVESAGKTTSYQSAIHMYSHTDTHRVRNRVISQYAIYNYQWWDESVSS